MVKPIFLVIYHGFKTIKEFSFDFEVTHFLSIKTRLITLEFVMQVGWLLKLHVMILQ